VIRWPVIIAVAVLIFCVAFWVYVDEVAFDGLGA
jgi:hypothetical protein